MSFNSVLFSIQNSITKIKNLNARSKQKHIKKNSKITNNKKRGKTESETKSTSQFCTTRQSSSRKRTFALRTIQQIFQNIKNIKFVANQKQLNTIKTSTNDQNYTLRDTFFIKKL